MLLYGFVSYTELPHFPIPAMLQGRTVGIRENRQRVLAVLI